MDSAETDVISQFDYHFPSRNIVATDKNIAVHLMRKVFQMMRGNILEG
jgi:hypothetical protein